MNSTPVDDAMIEDMVERFQIACPQLLRDTPCWLLWKATPGSDGKIKKVPYYVSGRIRQGAQGSDADVAALATFSQALEAFSGGGYSGLGFATLDRFGLVCADFDDKHGRGLHPNAGLIASSSYSERSHSGLGIHTIWSGQCQSQKNHDNEVELFGNSGFLVYTGNRLNACEIEPLPESVKAHLLRLTATTTQKPQTSTEEGLVVPAQTIAALRSALRVLDPDGYDSWVRQGQRLKGLGDAGYGLWMDWSERSNKFDQREADAKWDSFTGDRTGYPAIFKEAQSTGNWVNPESKIAREFDVIPSGGGDVEEAQQQQFFVSLREMLLNTDPPDYLIEDHIPAGGVSLLIGPPGVGKSFVALDWALCVSTGTQWHGNDVKPGCVAILAGEGFSGFRTRCAAWGKHNAVDVSLEHLVFNQVEIELIDEASCRQIHDAVAGIVATHGPLAMVVVDTFNRCSGDADENSNSDVAAILRNVGKYLVRPFGCAVLIVHHSGHGEKRARGASALPAGADAAYQLEATGDTVVLKSTKMKDAEPPAQKAFRLETVVLDDWPPNPKTGECLSSLVLVPADAPVEASKPLSLNQRRGDGLESLRQAVDEGKCVDTPAEITQKIGLGCPSRVVAEDVWRELFYTYPSLEAGASLEAKQTAFRRMKNDLLKMGRVNGSHGYFWSL